MTSGYRPCPDCGGELVDVDNPLRREVRHRRGSPPCTPLTPEQRAARDEQERRVADLLRDAIVVADPDRPITFDTMTRFLP